MWQGLRSLSIPVRSYVSGKQMGKIVTEPHEHEDEKTDMVQITDILDVRVNGGWIFFETHVFDEGEERHLALCIDPETCMQLANMAAAGLHMYLAAQSVKLSTVGAQIQSLS